MTRHCKHWVEIFGGYINKHFERTTEHFDEMVCDNTFLTVRTRKQIFTENLKLDKSSGKSISLSIIY